MSEHTRLLKLAGTCNNYQSFITLASLREKGQSPHGWEQYLSTLKDFRCKSSYFIVNANFNTNSHFGSLSGMSKEDNSSNYSEFFTSSLMVTMSIMITSTTFIEERLVKMAHANTKLTRNHWQEKSANNIPHEQGWGTCTKYNWVKLRTYSFFKDCISRWCTTCI